MIKGNILGLRAIETDDLALMRDWRNIEDFRRNFREVRELNLSHQKNWFEKTVVASSNDFMFMIERLSPSEPLGICGLAYVNWVIRSADFSFYIGHEKEYIDQQGVAAEAANLLIQYAFNTLNLNKIWMELYEFDQRKITFFTESFNFKIDGKLRANCFDNGRYYDSLMLSLLANDWRENLNESRHFV